MERLTGLDVAFLHWLKQQHKTIVASQPVSGGCVAESQILTLNDDSKLFIKQMSPPISDLFQAEALGLTALSQSKSVKTPDIVFQNEHCLVLEYIQAGSRSPLFDEVLGRQLAALHSVAKASFGFVQDTFCGSTRQPNSLCDDGYRFYSEQRFLYLANSCYERGLLAEREFSDIERICQKLPELVPLQPPVLIHGDLWNGNVHCDPSGQPLLVDPAVYYGWAEADLAMTRLFGGFSSRFYAAYEEIQPLNPGWESRMPLYNLWHLLNHLLLFGKSYLADVKQVIHAYV